MLIVIVVYNKIVLFLVLFVFFVVFFVFVIIFLCELVVDLEDFLIIFVVVCGVLEFFVLIYLMMELFL